MYSYNNEQPYPLPFRKNEIPHPARFSKLPDIELDQWHSIENQTQLKLERTLQVTAYVSLQSTTIFM